MFNEIGIYQVKAERQEDFEALIKEVAIIYNTQDGVVDIKFIKNNYVLDDFTLQNPEGTPKRLNEVLGSITYVMYCVFENESTFLGVYKDVSAKYYKRLSKLLAAAPKIMLGVNIV